MSLNPIMGEHLNVFECLWCKTWVNLGENMGFGRWGLVGVIVVLHSVKCWNVVRGGLLYIIIEISHVKAISAQFL
jgi:hypothetical protein